MERFVDELTRRGHRCVIVTSAIRGEPVKYGARSVDTDGDSTSPRFEQIYQLNTGSSLAARIIAQGHIATVSLLRGVKNSLSSGRPDLIVATVPAIPSAFSAYALSRLLHVPYAIDLRDAWPDLIENIREWDAATSSRNHRHSPSALFTSKAATAGGKLLQSVLNRANLITTTSRRLEVELKRRGLENVHTVRNTPIGDLGCRRKDPRTTVIFGKDRPLRILYAGTVGRAQGLSNAINALRLSKRSGATISMRVIGAGAELEAVKRHAAISGEPVQFIDPVKVDDLQPHYDWADVCLVHLRDWPALDRTVPSKLYEIMWRGIPIVISTNGESSDIVRETKSGFTAEAMNPQSLSSILLNIYEHGLTSPMDTVQSDKWLDENANPIKTSCLFASEVEKIADKHSSRTS